MSEKLDNIRNETNTETKGVRELTDEEAAQIKADFLGFEIGTCGRSEGWSGNGRCSAFALHEDVEVEVVFNVVEV